MVSDFLSGTENLFFHETDIVLDEAFLLEGGGGKHEFDRMQFVDVFHRVVAVMDCHLSFGGDGESHEHRIVIGLELQVNGLPLL